MEEDKGKKSRWHFDQQFKLDVVRLLFESGKPFSEVAKELGFSRDLMEHWLCHLFFKAS